MDVWMDGWINGWMDARMHECIHGCMHAWMHACMCTTVLRMRLYCSTQKGIGDTSESWKIVCLVVGSDYHGSLQEAYGGIGAAFTEGSFVKD